MARRQSLRERFYGKVEFIPGHPCWEWIGHLNEKGYGGFQYQRKNWRAHRISWLIHKGSIPENMLVLHKCDNPSCVNIDHLFLGTTADNAQDCASKGRHNSLASLSKIAIAKRARKFCKHGHSYSAPQNLYIRPGGYRDCRECHRQRSRVRKAKLRRQHCD